MFCALQGPPLILRIYGYGTTVLPQSPQWATLYPLFLPLPGARQILQIEITKVQTSCGMGVPLFSYQEQRRELVQWAEQKGETELNAYRQAKNRISLDGLVTPLGRGDGVTG